MYKNYRCKWPACDWSGTSTTSWKCYVIQKHTNEKLYKCTLDDCEKTFPTKTSLNCYQLWTRLHLSVTDTRFACSEYAWLGSSSGRLSNHISSIHRKEKRHKCLHCLKGFNWGNNLGHHLVTSHRRASGGSEEIPALLLAAEHNRTVQSALEEQGLGIRIGLNKTYSSGLSNDSKIQTRLKRKCVPQPSAYFLRSERKGTSRVEASRKR